jgi:hypothetical protein
MRNLGLMVGGFMVIGMVLSEVANFDLFVLSLRLLKGLFLFLMLRVILMFIMGFNLIVMFHMFHMLYLFDFSVAVFV